jgi:hypothetical protein
MGLGVNLHFTDKGSTPLLLINKNKLMIKES